MRQYHGNWGHVDRGRRGEGDVGDVGERDVRRGAWGGRRGEGT